MSALPYLEHLGNQLFEAGDYEGAWAQYLHVLSLREKNPMTKSSDMEISLNKLDCLLDKIMAEDSLAARPFLMRSLLYYGQALTRWQRQPRRHRDEIAIAQNNLGALFCQTDKWAAARPYLEQALKTHQQIWGAKHPNTACVYSNLAHWFWLAGNLEQAEAHYMAALHIYKQTLGPVSLETIAIQNVLAQLSANMGEFPDIQKHPRQALPAYHLRPGLLNC